MSDFYCGGCCKWVRGQHLCPGRQIYSKAHQFTADNSEQAQREKLLRRKAELERELDQVNRRLGGVQ